MPDPIIEAANRNAEISRSLSEVGTVSTSAGFASSVWVICRGRQAQNFSGQPVRV